MLQISTRICLKPAAMAEDTAPTFPHEIRFPQYLRHGIIERQLRGIRHGKRKVAKRRVIQIIRQRNAVPGRDLQHFVFAITVERRPLNRFRILARPCKIDRLAKMLDAKCTACEKTQKVRNTNPVQPSEPDSY